METSDVRFYLTVIALTFIASAAITLTAVLLMSAGKISAVSALLMCDGIGVLVWGSATLLATLIGRPFGVLAFGLGFLVSVWRTHRTWTGQRTF